MTKLSLVDRINGWLISQTCKNETHHDKEIKGIMYCTLDDERYRCQFRSENKLMVLEDKKCSYIHKCNYQLK